MDNRLKQIYDNFDRLKIGLDEEFKFNCTMCGKCCINREDILLNPKDMFNLAKELNMEPKQVLEAYCETYIGSDSRFPIVRLKPKGSIKRCPLLKDRKCSVHKAKPTVCAMFPIGRCVASERKQGAKKSDTRFPIGEIQYIFTDPQCGDSSKTHTVREWLREFNLELEDEFFIEWNRILVRYSMILQKAEKHFNPETMNIIWSSVLVFCYLNYNTAEDFMSQFAENIKKLNVGMDKIDQRYKK